MLNGLTSSITEDIEAVGWSPDDFVKYVGASLVNNPMALKTLKADSETVRIGGYLVVWGSPAVKDLEGEYFTPDTDLRLEYFKTRPILFHHGLDGEVKSSMVGYIDTLVPDEIGVWAEGVIELRNKYARAIARLVEQGVLNWSSGALPHLVDVTQDGEIKRWPIVEGSMTPSPAEPRRTDIRVLKSIKGVTDMLPNLEELIEAKGDQGVSDASDSATSDNVGVEPEAPQDGEGQQSPEAQSPDDDISADSKADAGDDTPEASDDTDGDPKGEGEMITNQELITAVVDSVVGQLDLKLSEEQKSTVVASVGNKIASAVKMSEIKDVPQQSIKGFFADTDFAQWLNSELSNASTGGIDVAALVGNMKTDKRNNSGAGGASKAAGTDGVDFGGSKKPLKLDFGGFKSRWDRGNCGAAEMSYYLTLGRAINGKGWLPEEPEAFFQELTGKAQEESQKGDLDLTEGSMKALQIMSQIGGGMKANELASTSQTAFGEEWVPDLWLADLWVDERLDNVVLPRLNPIEMPSDPFNLPIEGVDPTVYGLVEATNSEQLTDGDKNIHQMTKVGSGKLQMTAGKLGLRLSVSDELNEDAIIPVLAAQRRQALRVIQNAQDYVIINGDSATSGNVNYDGGTPPTYSDSNAVERYQYGGGNGFVEFTIGQNGASNSNALCVNAGGVPTLAMFRLARAKMARQYRTMLSDLMWIVDPDVYIQMLNMDEFLTMDKAGALATAQTGQLGVIDGVPVFVSNELETASSNGKVSSTPANNDKGRAILVYRPAWRPGYRRRIRVTSEFKQAYDAHLLVISLRMALVKYPTNCATAIYNITLPS